jgi:hypothetical protein
VDSKYFDAVASVVLVVADTVFVIVSYTGAVQVSDAVIAASAV